MAIAFITVSMLLGMFLSYIWSSKGVDNVLIKMLFSSYTLWAIFMLLAQLAPMINTGAMRLL